MFWVCPKLKCFHILSQLRQIIWNQTKHFIQTEINQTNLVIPARRSQKALRKKTFMCLPLCTRDGDPMALGSQKTRRQSRDHSRARPGYVKQQGWVLWERAGCVLWTLLQKKGASCGQHSLPGSVTSDVFSLRGLLSPPAYDLLSEFPLLSFWVTAFCSLIHSQQVSPFSVGKSSKIRVIWALILPCALQEEISPITRVDQSSRLGHHGNKPWSAYVLGHIFLHLVLSKVVYFEK